LAGCGVQAVLLEELGQSDRGDAHAEGPGDEVEGVRAASVGVAEEELGDRPGVAGPELARGTSVQAMVGLLDGLLRGQALLSGGGGSAETEQPCDLGHLEAGVGIQEKMAEQSRGVVVGALVLAEVEGAVEQAALLGGEGVYGDVRLVQPLGEGVGGHGSPSRKVPRE
jgi:hypothetical protein